MNPQQLINDLSQRVEKLEAILNGQSKGSAFEELIRDTVLFDKDGTTARTTSVTVTIPAGGGSQVVTLPKTSDIYLRVYFRGKPYNIPAFNLI